MKQKLFPDLRMSFWVCFYRKINLISGKITKVVLLGNLGYEFEGKMFFLFIPNVVLVSVKLQHWIYIQKVPTAIMWGIKSTMQWARWQEANRFPFLHLTVTSNIWKQCTVGVGQRLRNCSGPFSGVRSFFFFFCSCFFLYAPCAIVSRAKEMHLWARETGLSLSLH